MDQQRTTQFSGRSLHDQQVTLLGDGAQTFDLLGYQPYVDAMVEVLAQEELQTPFSVGVFGRWGTGKSTFMNLLNRQLSWMERQDRGETGGFHTVWFQPWQFEAKEEVWKALLLSVIRYLEVVQAKFTTQKGKEAEEIKRTLKALAISVGKLALDKSIRAMTSGTFKLDDILNAYAETVKDNSQFINTFRDQFGKLKEKILIKTNVDIPRLFIFIDDLDRCNPDNCIVVLEAIKLFFDLPECVFVIGIDRVVVQKGIEQKYKQSIGIHGQDYVDKLIQLPFSLPPIREGTFETFVGAITRDFDFSPEIQSLIVQASEGNPRRAKRLSNCLQLTRTVAARLYEDPNSKELRTALNDSKLALLLTLQVRYPVAYLWLTQHPLTLQELDRGWVKNDSGENGPEGGYRAQLVDFLTSAYGKDGAVQTAEAFIGLWRYAQSSKVGVDAFLGGEELIEYMRITGIVDDERASSIARSKLPTAMESLDAMFVGPAEEDADEEEKNAADDIPGGDKKNPDEQKTEYGRIREQAENINRDWERFKNSGVRNAVIFLPGLLTKAQRLPEESMRLLERMAEFLQANPELDSEEARGIQADLNDLSQEKAYRHVASVAGAFVLVWPVVMMIVGNMVEFVVSNLSQEKMAGLFELFGVNKSLRDIPLDMNQKPLFEFVLDLPSYFPGGVIFFWSAALYSFLAIVFWFKAKKKNLMLKRRD